MKSDELEEMARIIAKYILMRLNEFKFEDCVSYITKELRTLRSKPRKEDAEKLNIAIDAFTKISWLVMSKNKDRALAEIQSIQKQSLKAILKKDEEESK